MPKNITKRLKKDYIVKKLVNFVEGTRTGGKELKLEVDVIRIGAGRFFPDAISCTRFF